MDISAVRSELAAVIQDHPQEELNVYDTVPDNIVVPAVVLVPRSPHVEYHQAMGAVGGAFTRLNYDVLLLVQRVAEGYAQDMLDAYASGDNSIPALVEADQTLGGTVEMVTVTECRDYGLVTFGEVLYLGARFTTEIYG
jgi:hypothetical protein